MANRNKNKRSVANTEVSRDSAKRSGSPPILHLYVTGILEGDDIPCEVTADIKLPFTLAECALKIAEAAFSIADELCYKNGVLVKKSNEL